MTDARSWIEVETGNGVWATLTIRNDGGQPLEVHNPRTEAPTEGWEHSREAYQAAVLQSYGFLQIELRAEDLAIERLPVYARAGHLVALPLRLSPGDQFDLAVPLDELYALQPGAEHELTLTYGDETGRYAATARFTAPS